MTYKDGADLTEYINSIYDVENWKVGDVQIWPIIRVSLLDQLIFADSSLQVQQAKAPAKIFRSIRILKNALESIIIQMYNIYRGIERHEDVALLGFHQYRNLRLADGRFYNVHLDPIVDVASKHKWRVKIFERRIFLGKENYKLPPYSSSILMTIPWIITLIIAKLKTKFDKSCLPEEYDIFCDDMKKRGIRQNYLPSKKSIIFSVNCVQIAKEIFKRMIDKKCKIAIFVDGESLITQAFILACRDLNIPTAELQHGIIDETHYAFAKWKCNNGYYNMPDYYLCWDKESANVIENWAKDSKLHKVLIVGNLWHALVHENSNLIINKSMKDIIKIMKSKPKCVLISEQIGLKLPEFVYNTIDSNEECFFVIRRHPSTHPKEVAYIKEFCAERSNAFYDAGENLPVIFWYNYIDVHITLCSSVISECAWWGIPSVSVDVEDIYGCKKMYKNEYESGYLHAAKNKKELDHLLHVLVKRTDINISSVADFENAIRTVVNSKV